AFRRVPPRARKVPGLHGALRLSRWPRRTSESVAGGWTRMVAPHRGLAFGGAIVFVGLDPMAACVRGRSRPWSLGFAGPGGGLVHLDTPTRLHVVECPGRLFGISPRCIQMH